MSKNYIKKTSIRLVLLLLAVSAIFTYLTLSHATGFSDVPQSHWAYASINEASTDGVINGVGNNKFDPNGNVTLAQFTAILTRMTYPAEVEASTATGEWWAKNAEVARNHNFFQYLENTDMTHALTREEMAHIIFNAYPDRKADPASNDYALDVALAKIPDQATLSYTYKYSVAFCYGKGILQGVDKAGNFNPKATLTRAQTAAIYVRYKNALNGTAPVETPVVPETPVEQPVETPVETPAAADNRDLNEWGIPHFRMLDGENVQQMMDRINAVTPAYREGYLTNGKPITEENIKEMIVAVREDMPEGSIVWRSGDYFFLYDNAKAWGTAGLGCISYAHCVSDYIFGEDAPVMKHMDYDKIKIGDAVYYNELGTSGSSHMTFAITNIFSGTSDRGFRYIDGGGNDTIGEGISLLSGYYKNNGGNTSVVYARY